MAEESEDQATDTKGGNSTMKIVIIAVVLSIVLSGGIAGGMMFFLGGNDSEQQAGEDGEEEEEVERLKPQVFLLSSGEITPGFSARLVMFGIDTSYIVNATTNGQHEAMEEEL